MNWFSCGNRDARGHAGHQSRRVLIPVLGLVFALGLVGFGATNTTTTLTSDVNPSVHGQPVTFTATVTPVPDGGTVTFKDGATVLGSVAVDTGTGKANFSTNSLSVGSHSITAEYSGTTDYNPSTSFPLDQKVDKASTTVSVGSSTNPSVTGQSVTFTATVSAVSPGSGTPTGTVDFYASGNLIAADCPLSGGTATCSRSFAHIESPVAVTAYYSGDTNFNPSDNVLNPLTQTVDKASTTTSITPSGSSWVGDSYTVSGWVIVTSPGSGIPTGTVTVRDDTGETCAANLVEGAWSCFLSSSGAAGTRTLTAVYEGDANYAGSSGSTTHQVATVATTLALTDEPDPSVIGGAVTLTATATAASGGGSPTGTVSFSIGTTPLGSVELVSSGTDESKAVLVTTQIPAGSHTITATYPGDGRFAGSTATAEHTASKRETTTLVMGSDTALVVGDTVTVTVRVVDTSPGASSMPTGTVSVSVSPTDQGTPTSWSHALVAADAGEFTFTYTPTSGETTPHTFTATYDGDDTHEGSTGSFQQAIITRAADIQLVCNPSTAYIFQDVACQVHVEDDTTAGTPITPSGDVTFDDDGKNGVFSVSGTPGNTWPLDGSGNLSVIYTPSAFDAGTTTITATYNGSAVHIGKSTTQLLTVLLRPTEVTVNGCTNTILVNQECSYTVTVEEADGIPGTATAPFGTLSYSSYLGSDATQVPNSGAAPSGTFTYTCLGLDGHAGIDTIYAHYTPNDGIHAASGGGFGQAIQRRPTITTVTGSGTPAGVTYTATVQEDSGNAGTDTILQGNIHLLQPSEYPCTGLSGTTLTCPGSFATTSPLVNVTVQFEPTDRTHLGSTGSVNIERYDQFPDDPGDGSDGSECDDGCGSGGKNVAQMIFDLNASEVALQAVKLGLDTTALVLDVIPDGVITGGVVVQTGVTIPYSDIAKAVVAGAGILLDIAIMSMDTDLDDDGLPDVLEENVTDTDYNEWDTDGDGMGDWDELEEASGYYGGSRRPDPNDSDSDDDGIPDGDEQSLTHTNFCVADTDCDTVIDGGQGLAAVGEAETWGFADIRDHADPLMEDTDGDGLRDDVEIAAGCPFVNDDDSDNDGLQDGFESWDGNGTCVTGDIGDSLTQSSLTGETDFCDPDTDGDGLTDGEEVALLGGLPVTSSGFKPVAPRGVSTVFGQDGSALTATIPALDDDSDNDGLSDCEEVSITHTNPLDQDSDNDTLSDANELIAVVGSSWPNRSFIQVSDPLDPDSDDDGLPDQVEYPGSGLGMLRTSGGVPDNVCSYVGDDDSDDDGLQDGHEDLDKDGQFDLGTIGTTQTIGTGETNLCNPDTDGDGLDDGQEEWQLGAGSVAVTSQDSATIAHTVPALDMDSDDDGLSDGEEVNVTHTDPLDWDTDNDTLSDLNELLVTGGTWPQRTFSQVSDPLDPDTDDDGLIDSVEYNGTGSDRFLHLSTDGVDDLVCPYVNDDDSDDDGLQDGGEDANHDGMLGVGGSGISIGDWGSQATKSVDYWECNLCNPDTDGDGLLDGEEVALLGGGPILGRPRPIPGFNTVIPEAVSTVLPLGTGPAGSPPGTRNSQLGPYTFVPAAGASMIATIPALDNDSDNDGLSDYEEVNITGTDPLDQDSDNDTLMDSDELIAIAGTWPQRTFDQESNPLDINTDDDHLFDPQEFSGSGLSTLAGALGGTRDMQCPFVNDDDSDDDGIQDGAVVVRTFVAVGVTYSWTHYEDFADVTGATDAAPGTVRTVVTPAGGEQNDDSIWNVCDPDSDGDGLLDGEEVAIGTDPGDWDTDDDGRNDWHEQTGGGPIPTDPFDPDTDDDGLLDSAEVFGSNPTNPTNCDTDADGLCDGGARTPYMTSGHPSAVVSPRCRTGIGGHPNPLGIGEDEDGDGAWDSGETDPNNPDTDGDAVGDGFERLSFSVSRQSLIPATDLFGRPITVVYPEANNVKPACGCMNPLTTDSDGDGLLDGEEDLNHDGHFDFLVSDFDYGHHGPIPGPAYGSPLETNPCDPDTDYDGLTDLEELRGQANPPSFFPFNPTNPLDHDTDNDWIYDGPEVRWVCTELLFVSLDNDGDTFIDEDPVDEVDNDGDGLIDEDDVDFYVRYVPVLDPTNRDSDSDGFIDGLDEDPCNTQLIPIAHPVVQTPVDTDGDGFADDDEIAAGTHPNDPTSFPCAFGSDLDLDGVCDDRLWLTDTNHDGTADTVTIDIDTNVLVDLRVEILSRDLQRGDFDGDGQADDGRYTISYAFANRRVIQPRLTVVILDYGCDLRVDQVEVTK